MSTEFSVAMSVYKNDSAEHFDRAFWSVTERQSVRPSEIILVVDGPVGEELDAVISKYEEKYDTLNVIRLPENKGLGNALRVAVESAKYELIARMDSDDVSLPTRFESQLRAFEADPELDIVGGDIAEFIDSEENVVALRRVPTTDAEIKKELKGRCPFNHVSVMYKKSAVLAAGGYLDLFWNEDYYLWIRMYEQGCKMANTGDVLVSVRVGEAMYRRRGGARYYKSEKFLQDYMRKRRIIGFLTYAKNLSKRVIVQILMPPRVRGWIIRRFARS